MDSKNKDTIHFIFMDLFELSVVNKFDENSIFNHYFFSKKEEVVNRLNIFNE